MDPDLPGSKAAESDDGPGPSMTPLARLEAALAGLEAALASQKSRAEADLAGLRRQLDDAKTENARLAAVLKAEQARVQRLEDLTSAVSGRVDSAIGELESILEP